MMNLNSTDKQQLLELISHPKVVRTAKRVKALVLAIEGHTSKAIAMALFPNRKSDIESSINTTGLERYVQMILNRYIPEDVRRHDPRLADLIHA